MGVAIAVSLVATGPVAVSGSASELGSRRVVGGHILDETFDDTGTFPPTGWTYAPLRPFPFDWHATSVPQEIHSGTGAVAILRQDTFIQSEFLFTPSLDLRTVDPDGLFLSFWYRTDPFFFHGAITLFQVHAMLDEDVVSTMFLAGSVTESGWAWRNVVMDISHLVGAQGLTRFRFLYHGIHSGDVAIDDVRVGYLEPPLPPPNDACVGAMVDEYTLGPGLGAFEVTGNTFFANHDYTLDPVGSCTGFDATGRDLVWRVKVPPAQTFVATMTTAGNWDDTLFLVTDCADPQGTCVEGDRGLPDGASVSVTNWSGVTDTYYLIASGWGAASGEFTLTGAIETPTSLRSDTWGGIKAEYR